MRILGIESSCDETAVAIMDDNRNILSHTIFSQVDIHNPYGGVVPEVAARSHLGCIDTILKKAITNSNVELGDLDAFAATSGPGLIGGLIVGMMFAKSFSSIYKKPFIAVNHLEAHALTVRAIQDIPFPYILLLASGGHCQLLLVKAVGEYLCMGQTLDDAAGECFDKVARMLNLGFPGGPAIEKASANGDPNRFNFPLPLKGREGCDFSFSGLKTAVKTKIDSLAKVDVGESLINDLSASVQLAIINHIVDRSKNALDMCYEFHPKAFVASGGVAANNLLRNSLEIIAHDKNIPFIVPDHELCTDNGVMIAWAGLERYRLGLTDELDFKPRPRWPLG